MPQLSTVTARKKLKNRREPHWMRLHKGCYLGFRRGPETWIARYSNRNAKGSFSHQYKSLDAHSFDTAKDLAEGWFANMGSPAARVIKRGSVRDALETYIAYLNEQGRGATADNAEDRFKLIVWETPFALLPLEDQHGRTSVNGVLASAQAVRIVA